MASNAVSKAVSSNIPITAYSQETNPLNLTTHHHPGHLTMISFGGVVGASIWYGVGFAVAYSGPIGALICFFIIGVDVYFVMQCLGEMSTLFPVQGAFIELAGRFVDESLSFSLGWSM